MKQKIVKFSSIPSLIIREKIYIFSLHVINLLKIDIQIYIYGSKRHFVRASIIFTYLVINFPFSKRGFTVLQREKLRPPCQNDTRISSIWSRFQVVDSYFKGPWSTLDFTQGFSPGPWTDTISAPAWFPGVLCAVEQGGYYSLHYLHQTKN